MVDGSNCHTKHTFIHSFIHALAYSPPPLPSCVWVCLCVCACACACVHGSCLEVVFCDSSLGIESMCAVSCIMLSYGRHSDNRNQVVVPVNIPGNEMLRHYYANRYISHSNGNKLLRYSASYAAMGITNSNISYWYNAKKSEKTLRQRQNIFKWSVNNDLKWAVLVLNVTLFWLALCLWCFSTAATIQ